MKDFDPRAYMDKTEVLRSDAFSQYGVAAACQAVEESGVIGTLPPERVAVYFGSGIGGIRTFTEEHNKLLARGPSGFPPYFYPYAHCQYGCGDDCHSFQLPGGGDAFGDRLRLRHQCRSVRPCGPFATAMPTR